MGGFGAAVLGMAGVAPVWRLWEFRGCRAGNGLGRSPVWVLGGAVLWEFWECHSGEWARLGRGLGRAVGWRFTMSSGDDTPRKPGYSLVYGWAMRYNGHTIDAGRCMPRLVHRKVVMPYGGDVLGRICGNDFCCCAHILDCFHY